MNRMLILLISLGASSSVWAGSNGTATGLSQFSPPPGDVSVDYLHQIFGNVIDQIASGSGSNAVNSNDVLGQMMAVFCSAVLFLAMVFVAYTTIRGTVDSAHDGELLGRKMSEIWVPIRTVGGTAFLLPLGSGYCLIQMGVLWCAIHGVGVADAIWSAGIHQISRGGMVANPIIPDACPLAANILRDEVCAAAMNKQYADSGRTTRIQAVSIPRTVTNTGDFTSSSTPALALDSISSLVPGSGSQYNALWKSSYQVIDYKWRAVDQSGNPDPAYMNPDVCGGISWKESWESSAGNANTKVIKAPIMAAHAAAVTSMIAELKPVADQIVAGQKPAPGAIDVATEHYISTLKAAAQAAVNNTSDSARADFLKSAEAGGWIFAGTWYNQIVKMNDVMQSTLNGLPSAEPISITDGRETQLALQNYQDAMAVVDEYAKNRSAAVKSASYQETDIRPPQSGEGAWEYIKKLISAPFMGAINQMTGQIAGSNLNHMSQMKSFGDSIVVAGWGLLGTMATAAGVAGSWAGKVVSAGFDAGASLQFVSGVVAVLVLGLLGFGATLSTYAPLIPFITWVASVANWVVLVIEAVLAAPIWAAAHIHPDGDDAVGRGGMGYGMILSLIMRPPLMIFGLVTAMLLSEPLSGLVNTGFMTAVAGVQADSMTGLVSFLAYVAIYTIMMTTILHIIFSLIHWLPDHVPKWIGGAIGGGPASPDQKEREGAHVFGGAINTAKSGAGGQKHRTPNPTKGDETIPGGEANQGPGNEELLGLVD